jgi:spermidine synthase
MAAFVVVFLISACGLVYELVAGALASYVLGDSVTQFSTVIGAYLSAMGLGAWLSRYIEKELARVFVELEIAVALVGGFSAPALFLAFGHLHYFRPALYALVVAVGVFVGLEIPLLLRILEKKLEFKELVARVLSVDYIGALFASVLFPILLVPRLGLVRTSLAFGVLNVVVGFWSTSLLRAELKRPRALQARCGLALVALCAGLIGADRLTDLAEEGLFADPIVYSHQSAYQRIVVTRGRASFQLFLDGNLQFSSADEYRYHEALVHPAMAAAAARKRVLVLGGGDGLAVRELLKHRDVERITLVDLDPEMTRLSQRLPMLRELNGASLADPRVTVVNADAMAWLSDQPRGPDWDAVIVDFPDPNNFSLGKLYTTRFYRLLKSHLAEGAAVAVQSTSPLFSRRSFWCIERTLREAGFAVRPYHAFVPSFGEWGFMLAKQSEFAVPAQALPGLKFLSNESMAALFVLGPDIQPLPAEVNKLNNQVLVQYYEHEWRRWN